MNDNEWKRLWQAFSICVFTLLEMNNEMIYLRAKSALFSFMREVKSFYL